MLPPHAKFLFLSPLPQTYKQQGNPGLNLWTEKFVLQAIGTLTAAIRERPTGDTGARGDFDSA